MKSRPLFRLPLALLCCLLVLAGTMVTALAQDAEMPKLGIAPVDADGSYFDITMKPGEHRELKVHLGNFGTKTVSAHTYAADVYTILNGGFGAKLADEPATGVTKWLDYEADTFDLDPGTMVERTFTVTVPKKTKPGEYITSLAIQNADPIKGTGDIALNQVVRQVIAVAITIPGSQKPKLKITGATYELLPGYARVLVGIDNTGNVRLKPAGDVVIRDGAGTEIDRSPITMDSVYAGTQTSIEVILLQPLQPGDYTVSVTLKDDAHDLSVEATALPFTTATADATGTPGAEVPTIAIESVTVNEFRDQSTNALQGVELVVGIDNPALPVENARLTLHVSHDGEKVEDLVLGSSLSFPGGKAEFRQRYLPMTGWTAGTWSFSVTLDAVDPNTGTVTELASADAANTVVVS
jgi:hypothetical protein